MRQSQREIQDPAEIAALLAAGQVCHLALNNAGAAPYLVALNYGFDYQTAGNSLVLWFHSAAAGRKLELLAADAQVGFQIETKLAMLPDNLQACAWGMQYESLVGIGLLRLVTERSTKLYGLNRLMSHYGGAEQPIVEPILNKTAVLQLVATEFAAKRSRNLRPQLA